MGFSGTRAFGWWLAVGGILAGWAGSLAVDSASASAPTTKTFVAHGCGNTVPANVFLVPAGVTSVKITATGSAGQTIGSSGGSGDVVSGVLSGLRSGEVLDVCVDYGGGAGGPAEAQAAGGAGGGASGVALGRYFSAPGVPVLIAAGGGGGTDGGGSGGGAGLPNGGDGSPECGGQACNGGGGGTQTTFGAGGAGDACCTNGGSGAGLTPAGPGLGGGGGAYEGGGGGGGYYGGGGGGGTSLDVPGGGGGGSDLCNTTSLPPGSSLTGCGVIGTNGVFGTASVVLTYTPVPLQLTVKRAGTGAGTVTSSPAGITCGSNCTHAFPAGTRVTLTAKPVSGSTFAGWSGACTGTRSCMVTMTKAMTVTATLRVIPPPSTEVTGAQISNVKRTATFDFVGSGGVGTPHFQCKLDSEAWKRCASPKAYTALSSGSHIFEARAIDARGAADPTPATRAFTIKLTR